MKCRICSRFFTNELTFSTLFKPPPLCPDCRRLRETDLDIETVPYQGGLLYYCYFSDADYPDPKQMRILELMIEKPLKLAVSQQSETSLFLFLDAAELAWIDFWIPMLEDYRQTVFFSPGRHDLERCRSLF